MSFFNPIRSKIVKLSNGNYIPLARNVEKFAIPGPWYGLYRQEFGKPERIHSEEGILRYCQCVEESTAQEVIDRYFPKEDPMLTELKGHL